MPPQPRGRNPTGSATMKQRTCRRAMARCLAPPDLPHKSRCARGPLLELSAEFPKSKPFEPMSLNSFSWKQKAAARIHWSGLAGGLLLLVLLGAPCLSSGATLLFDNLQAFASRLPVGD